MNWAREKEETSLQAEKQLLSSHVPVMLNDFVLLAATSYTDARRPIIMQFVQNSR